MKLPITQKILIDWGGERIFKDASILVDNGRIIEAVYEPPCIRGTLLWNNHPFKSGLKMLPDGKVENLCPCRDNTERGIVCAHAIALGLTLVKLATDPLREAKYRAELRHASRMASIDESAHIKRVPGDSPGAVPAALRVTLSEDWMQGCRSDSVALLCEAEYQGRRVALDEVPRNLPLAFSREDEALLFVIEDISGGPAKGRLLLNRFDFVNVIRLHAGRALFGSDGAAIAVNESRMTTFLRMDLDRENGEIILWAHTELPFVKEGEIPFYVVSERTGWVFGAGNLWQLENILPVPYHSLYEDAVVIARKDVLRFLKQELPPLSKHARVESDISLDLFTIHPGVPRFKLTVRGSPASLAATLHARYGDIEVAAGKPAAVENFAVPDPDDLMAYSVRNPGAERSALELLAHGGFAPGRGTGDRGDEDGALSIVGNREVLNFLGTQLPALRRRGWQVELEGKAAPYMESLDFVAPVVRIMEQASGGWFDVGFDFEDGAGSSLSHGDIQRALLKGESFIERGGRTVLIDSGAVGAMTDIFSDCATAESDTPGHFRMAGIYAPFVKSSLDALDGVDVESTPSWSDLAGRQNRSIKIEPVQLGDPLSGILRPYQKDGVNWLKFLEQHGFCGLLADEMGLGKTLQALAWLQLERSDAESPGKPALIVCPTSIVENWVEEAARFVPHLKVISLTGADRRDRLDRIPEADIAVTSYPILRRDVDLYAKYEFSAAILDEAQHIKNPSTQNATAAGKIRARHRLVLTGTPLENSVTDLWSMMDFLMPGYLGKHEAFRQHYELPISRGGPDAEAAQIRLRRKVHPFILRRIKTDVAKDLPPKIQKVASCQLTADQRAVYTELLDSSRRRISNMVSKQGFNKCRMEILTVLMRLRQVCCHLDLLKLPDLKAEYPSAKMDLFFELLDEALDSGHRILVFSQFVSMLHILRDELDRRGLAYCYLDGSTKDRMTVVHQFNTERSIPLFLISLKAGGTGLNLTGADMVIHFDPWWNPAVEDQATDRAHRIGQKRTVYSIKLITKGTVEEKVLALQEKKKAIISATLDADEQVLETMTWADIQELLSL